MNPRKRIGILAAAVVAAASVGVAASVRLGARDFAAGDPLLLADVANETGDTTFDKAVQVAATVGLGQSQHVSLYPRARLRATLSLMTITNPDTAVSWELAQDVAERDGVRFVLGLWLDRDAAGYRLKARLTDVHTYHDVFETEDIAPTRDDVIGQLDKVVRRTRRALGESSRDVADRSAPLPLVTTPSLEALRSYAQGQSAWRASEFTRAKEFWERAIDLDTGFAMAYGALGSFEYYVHNREAGERRYAAAFSRATRLTERERLELLRNQAAFGGQLDSAQRVSRVVAERFPSADSWFNYGTNLMLAQRYPEAIDALQRALTFKSSYWEIWVNLATSYKALRRDEEAIRAYRRAEAIDSGVLYRNNINHEFGGTLVSLNRQADAESVFRRMAASSRIADRALALRSLGLLALWQGRIDEAIGDLQQALEAAQQMNSLLSTGRNRLWLATAYRTDNRQADANTEVTRTMALAASPNFPPVMLAVLAYACHRLDRRNDVDTVVRMIHSRANDDVPSDRASAAVGDALRYLARKHPDSALVRLRQAEDFNFPVIQRMLKAEAFQAAGARDSAKATLLALLDREGFGAEGQDDFLRAPLVLGDVLLQLGDSAGAAKRYREFIERWRAAPADLPDLLIARARLAALTQQRP
jgi:tetratricopeptide (TPR) repeat protein